MAVSFSGYVTYPSGDGTAIRSYLVIPAGCGMPPAVLILRGVAGPDDGYVEIADRFAGAGYAVLVHGWQVRGDDPSDREVLADAAAALGYLASRDDLRGREIGVVGYCRGGAHGVLIASKHQDIRALILVHGMSRRRTIDEGHPCHPIEFAREVRCPVLILHGYADNISPVDGMREFAKALGRPQAAAFTCYPRAEHGFAVRTHPGFLASAAEDAHKKTIAFLRSHVSTLAH